MSHRRSPVGSLPGRWSIPLALTLASLLTGCGGPLEADVPAHRSSESEPHPLVNPVAPAAPMHESIADTVLCDAERCAGMEPGRSVSAAALYRTGKHGRGTNTQLPIPQNLQLADIDADGFSDFVQFSSNKLFVSKTDFNKTGILHLYANRPIKRVLLGDFSGGGSDQTCTITDDNALACYGVSPDRRELWWWFTQGSFLGDNEDAIVADFDNDGRDDVLVYPRGGGAYRMYSIKGSYFFNPTPSFNAGNLGTAASGLQLRAGDFNGDGRDDLMIINGYRQVIYYVSVWDGTYHTFWWAFSSASGFVGVDDQVTVARIDDNASDDFVLRNKVTGSTRFHRMDYNGGYPPAITYPGLGQISAAGNSQIFWGYMHGSLSEPGAYWRDDAMVYEQGWNGFARADARWDGSQLTYWWTYNQYAPNNHTGWASFSAKPWLLLKCKFSDIATTPQTDQFYRDLMYSALVPYWREVSYGSWDLSGSTVKDGWYTMSITNAAWSQSTVSRWDRVGYCMNAYGGSTAGYVNVIGLVNGEGDAGNHGGRVLATPNSSNSTFLAHETGHTFGWWDHSFDDTTRKNSDWSAPGEYFDYWDIMSAMAVYGFSHPQGVLAGPEMNAPYRTKQSFIPAHRQTRLVPATSYQTWRSNIAALNRPEANGPLMVRIGNDDANYYTIEYRMPSGWDQGIPRATVLVHRVTNGISVLITANGGPERLVGSTSSYPLGGRTFSVTVNAFAGAGYTADVSVTY
ncbi:VCBS repeat protein [Archangium gephyra]|uniref:VCBS repeat protein n=1 Tax=Archangium gephyra TaxID=48 RepID=A0ABX9JU88_9BACT|nr:FG-GAP-like repeat-containing protein [Archangium gephyra]REG27194.1 VCBS repeat protein [Archangium gephyra]